MNERRKRVGILGGSFDPVHYGHLLLADSAREHLGLDAVWLIPAAVSPLKPGGAIVDGGQRAEMLRLAIAGTPWLEVSTLELDRADISYTLDTVEQLVGQHPDWDWFLILGSDQIASLAKWHQPQRLFELVEPAIVDRAGFSMPPIESLHPYLRPLTLERLKRDGLVPMAPVDISSTDLRDRIAAGKSIRFRTPRAIEQYIDQHQLYRKPRSDQ